MQDTSRRSAKMDVIAEGVAASHAARDERRLETARSGAQTRRTGMETARSRASRVTRGSETARTDRTFASVSTSYTAIQKRKEVSAARQRVSSVIWGPVAAAGVPCWFLELTLGVAQDLMDELHDVARRLDFAVVRREALQRTKPAKLRPGEWQFRRAQPGSDRLISNVQVLCRVVEQARRSWRSGTTSWWLTGTRRTRAPRFSGRAKRSAHSTISRTVACAHGT